MPNRSTYIIIVLIATLFLHCGGDKPECLGPTGLFMAQPSLSVNNCYNVSLQPMSELIISEDSELRQCGWHKANGLSINTLPERYHGFIIINFETCMTVWELEYKKVNKKFTFSSERTHLQ
jgi:hypothetical protein